MPIDQCVVRLHPAIYRGPLGSQFGSGPRRLRHTRSLEGAGRQEGPLHGVPQPGGPAGGHLRWRAGGARHHQQVLRRELLLRSPRQRGGRRRGTDQDESTGYDVSISGTAPTSGSFQLLADDLPASIDFDSTAAEAKTALVALDDGHDASEWTVTGGPLPGTAITVVPPVGVSLEVGTSTLNTGTVHIDPA
jgi:hypothetical protein